MKRRGFLQALAGVSVAGCIPKPLPWIFTAAPAAPYVVPGLTFQELVIEVFRRNRAQIIANVTRDDTLLASLKRSAATRVH